MLSSCRPMDLSCRPAYFICDSYLRNANTTRLTSSLRPSSQTVCFISTYSSLSSSSCKFPGSRHQSRAPFPTTHASSLSNLVEQVVSTENDTNQSEGNRDSSFDPGTDRFYIDERFDTIDLRKLQFTTPALQVRDLETLPENWRRSKLAWLCKELPSHKRPTMTRILNAQKKWMRQEDATYVAVHCMRIRENESGFWVYKWMIQQHWFKFDFALATKLADYTGRERKYSKCREIFDDIINQGRVPCESTFHILTGAYLSATKEVCLMEAFDIYSRMILLGVYQPRLCLHNALFRALVSKPGGTAKQYLRQAEFIFHNLATSGLEIHKDIYGGLIWLHSYQDVIDKERILFLREEMQARAIEESIDVLLSILRACSKEGDVGGAEQTWLQLAHLDGGIPAQAFTYRMEVYARVGQPLRSLEIFRDMQKRLNSVNAVAHHKIIGFLCEFRETDLAETLMEEFVESGLKPLTPSYVDLMNMYFKLGLYGKVELAFSECLVKCCPNRAIYGVYLESLVQSSNVGKAELIFQQMLENEAVGVSSRSCNTILGAYISCDDHEKVEKMFDFMCEKKYEVDSSLKEKVDHILSSRKKVVTKPIIMKLSPEQREILVGLLLGGLQIEADEGSKQHYVCFDFKGYSAAHSVLKRGVHDKFHEWLHRSRRPTNDADVVSNTFSTIPHNAFTFYADQFWPGGRHMIPRLIHRWLSPRVLAYWYMYSGYRTSSGDILLKLKGGREGVQMVARALKGKPMDFKVKRKGKVFWLGFLGTNSAFFRRLIEPYVLDDLKDLLKADDCISENGRQKTPTFSGGSASESEDRYLEPKFEYTD